MDLSTAFVSTQQLLLVPVVIGVTAVLKQTFVTGTTNRWTPIVALVLGVAGAFLLPSETLQTTILAGIVVGCSAAGVYSGAKTLNG